MARRVAVIMPYSAETSKHHPAVGLERMVWKDLAPPGSI